MLVGLITFELHIPQARSLKEKRRVVKSLVERFHQRYRVSAMESAHHDLHQRAQISLALLVPSEGELDRMARELRKVADAELDAVVTWWDERALEVES